MGIKGFTNLLREFAPDAVKPRTIGYFRGKTLAIDVSCFLNRFIYGPDPHPARVQQGLYKLAIQLDQYNIKPVFVFDGRVRISEKQRETQKRELAKLKIRQSFQLERNRKSRLREIKGSAQLLRGYSPDQVSHILEDVRLDNAAQCWTENMGSGGKSDHQGQEAIAATDSIVHESEAEERALGSDRDGIGRQTHLRQVLKDSLLQEIDRQHIGDTELQDAEPNEIESGTMASHLDHGTSVETLGASTSIMENPGGPEYIIEEHDGNLVPKLAVVDKEGEEENATRVEFIRQRVQKALSNFVRVMDGNQKHLEEMETLTSRKQKALHQLELDLVQKIKAMSSSGTRQHIEEQGLELAQPESGEMEHSVEQVLEQALPTDTSPSPGNQLSVSSADNATVKDQLITSDDLGDQRAEDTFVEDHIVENQNAAQDDFDAHDNSAVHARPRLDVEPMSDMHLEVEDALGAAPIEDASERPVSGAEVGKTIQQVLSTHETIYWSLGRRSMRITWNLVVSCQQLIDAMGLPWIVAEDAEAEAVCAQLTTRGITDGTVSEDSDTAVFGDGIWIRHFGSKAKDIVEVNPVVARQSLGITRDAFRDLCILCGTDFSETIEGIGPKRAVRLIKYYGSIESIMANAGYKPREFFLYDHARRVFDRTPSIPEDMDVYKRRPPNEEKMKELLIKYDIRPNEVLMDVLDEMEAEEAKAQLAGKVEMLNADKSSIASRQYYDTSEPGEAITR
ncbi:Elongation of fatty acids protein 2 [Actinomortierella wolfii]|nr:Elongation of fatty acids protein 2 [Actinomortierella wolfii]